VVYLAERFHKLPTEVLKLPYGELQLNFRMLELASQPKSTRAYVKEKYGGMIV